MAEKHCKIKIANVIKPNVLVLGMVIVSNKC